MSVEPVGWKTYAGTTLTGFIPNPDPAVQDDLDAYLAEAMQDPEFRAAYEAAENRHRRACPGPLAVDGHEYQRRLQNRRRRRR